MPVYKDESNGTWMARFYYTDWTGKRKQKKKRGFKRQVDAKEYEREFLSELSIGGKCDMKLSTLVNEYMDDCKKHLKTSSYMTKKSLIDTKILPYLGDIVVSDITPKTIRHWQNEMLSEKNGYSQTYLRTMNNQLSSIFNYAVKYYNLPRNPCGVTGSIGKRKAPEMKIWTRDQYEKVIAEVDDPSYRIAFEILYWTGMREGEMLALTPDDIGEDKTITVNKTYNRIDGEDLFTLPKTEKSNRVVSISDFLYKDIKDYIGRLYGIKPNERIFYFTKSALAKRLDKAASKAGVERIRIHDLRHSHASLLIDMGYSIFAVAERLGHENVSTTMNTYGHLYPNKRDELVNDLNKFRE